MLGPLPASVRVGPQHVRRSGLCRQGTRVGIVGWSSLRGTQGDVGGLYPHTRLGAQRRTGGPPSPSCARCVPACSEVQKAVNTARGLYQRWCELLQEGASVGREELDWTTNELRNGLRSIEWDLEDLEETIDILGGWKAA